MKKPLSKEDDGEITLPKPENNESKLTIDNKENEIIPDKPVSQDGQTGQIDERAS